MKQIISVGVPYEHGNFWVVDVRYIKDDYRGHREKVTRIFFSPLNGEVVDSTDLM